MKTLYILYPDACGSRAILEPTKTRIDTPEFYVEQFRRIASRGRITNQRYVNVKVPKEPWIDLIMPAWSYSADEPLQSVKFPENNESAYGKGTLEIVHERSYTCSDEEWSDFLSSSGDLRRLASRNEAMGKHLALTLSYGDYVLLFEFYHQQVQSLESVLPVLNKSTVESLERAATDLYRIAYLNDVWVSGQDRLLSADEQVSIHVVLDRFLKSLP